MPLNVLIETDPAIARYQGVSAHGNISFDMPYISEIVPGLWQGGCDSSLVLPEFFRHVVSLHPWERYRVTRLPHTYLTIKAYDSTDQAMDIVDPVARWVNALRKDGPVLVHCQAGLNRSGVVVARSLMLEEGMSAEEAIALIRNKRSPACLCNEAFVQWLLAQ